MEFRSEGGYAAIGEMPPGTEVDTVRALALRIQFVSSAAIRGLGRRRTPSHSLRLRPFGLDAPGELLARGGDIASTRVGIDER